MPIDDVKQALLRGPEVPPPEALWPRLQTGQRTLFRRRRTLAGISASTFALVLAAAAWWPPSGMDQAARPVIAQAQPRDADDIRGDLRALDHALQVAYNRGASDVEIAPMWQARRTLAAEIDRRTSLEHDES